MIGLTISVINYEIDCYAGESLYYEDERVLYPDPMQNPRNNNSYTNILRCTVVFTSILSIICNLMRYRLKLRWLELYYNHSQNNLKSEDSDNLFHQYN